MKRLVLPLSLLAFGLTLTLVLGGCDAKPPATTQAAEPAPEDRPVVVFDMGHGEIFGATDTSMLGQSEVVRHMEQAGFRVVVNADSITATDLAQASGLVLAGPMRPLQKEEYAAVSQFVKRGGTTVMTIHVPYPVFAVPAHWGLQMGNRVIASERPLDPQDAGVFLASRVETSSVTEGVSNLFVLSGWPVKAITDTAHIVVSGGPDAWIDVDNDGVRTKADTTEPLGVVGVASVGSGQVVVIGDDAVFANVGIGQADNARLLDNILRLMRSSTES